jgi:hypothetical protein
MSTSCSEGFGSLKSSPVDIGCECGKDYTHIFKSFVSPIVDFIGRSGMGLGPSPDPLCSTGERGFDCV